MSSRRRAVPPAGSFVIKLINLVSDFVNHFRCEGGSSLLVLCGHFQRVECGLLRRSAWLVHMNYVRTGDEATQDLNADPENGPRSMSAHRVEGPVVGTKERLIVL